MAIFRWVMMSHVSAAAFVEYREEFGHVVEPVGRQALRFVLVPPPPPLPTLPQRARAHTHR